MNPIDSPFGHTRSTRGGAQETLARRKKQRGRPAPRRGESLPGRFPCDGGPSYRPSQTSFFRGCSRRAGQLIAEGQKRGEIATGREPGPGRGHKKVSSETTPFPKKTLPELGVTHEQSSQWKQEHNEEVPNKPLRPCRFPGCVELVPTGYCPKHSRETQAALRQRIGTRSERGYDYQWQQVRLKVLRREPWCRRCRANGKWVLAELVDHIVALPFGPRLALENLQPLCASCHAVKTAEDLRAGYTPSNSL